MLLNLAPLGVACESDEEIWCSKLLDMKSQSQSRGSVDACLMGSERIGMRV
jgi:hypothetical protein